MKRLAAPTALIATLLAAAPARAAFKVPGFELVYSYPAETTLNEPDLRQAKDVWPEMFDRARREIDIESFYCTPKPGDALEPTLRSLERAGRRGVRIRVTLDSLLEKNSAACLARLKRIPRLELHIAHWSALTGAGIVHAKFFTVDRDRAYVGSQNLDWRSLDQIHEMGLAISDAGVVKQVQSVFDHDWKITASSAAAAPDNIARPTSDRSPRAYLTASPWQYDPPGVGDSESELVKLIGEATDTIDVQNMEYLPINTYEKPERYYPPIDDALRAAAMRGVKINLLISDWSPQKKYLQSLAILPNVRVELITIPQAKEGPIPYARVAHSKYMVVDGKTLWMSTSNWRGGYLEGTRDLDVIVKDPKLAERADEVIKHLRNSAYAAPLDLTKDYPDPKQKD
ncbi:MAG: phospholipase [Elusimicrobia bacterium]|nr:phospholipase [Elusimicrobiota bacterium]